MILFDCHVHTTASGHAFGTLEEIASYCRRYHLEGFAVTDHGPAIPGSASSLYFQAIKMVPRELDGVKILRGIEANLMDYEGTLDLSDHLLKTLDVVIASFHDIIIKPSSRQDHTRALIAAAQNPLVDILGHTGRGPYRYDIPAVLTACKQTGTLIEINQWTLKGDPDNTSCRDIALACKALQVPVVVNSDSHLASDVGRVDRTEKLLSEIDFPTELIINRSTIVLKHHLRQKKPWINFD